MKVYIQNYNGVLDEVILALASRDSLTKYIHEADAFLFWQDVRGDLKDLSHLARTSLGKPVYVLQHGRGATRDYLLPNKFPLTATKIFVWGMSEKLRLLRAGIEDSRIVIVGCPLMTRLKPKVSHIGKRVLFIPIITEKEEPENLMAYAKLLGWQNEKLIEHLRDKHEFYKKSWNTKFVSPDKEDILPTIPSEYIYQNGLVCAKLTRVHDSANYLGLQMVTGQGDGNHVEKMLASLLEIDVVVCLEEGTLPLMATFLDIPVVVLNTFNWKGYGGVDYSKVEIINSSCAYKLDSLDKLPATLDHIFRNPKEKEKLRLQVAEYEGGASVAPNYVNTILENIGIKPEIPEATVVAATR